MILTIIPYIVKKYKALLKQSIKKKIKKRTEFNQCVINFSL